MKRKLPFCLLAFVMAIIMAVVSPAQVIATNTNKQYIKEIRIGYGEEGKEQLKKADYTILCDSSSSKEINANETGTGNAVYLGYTTTTNVDEAITDVAIMPMGSNGDRNYSFDAYDKEMSNLNEQITEKVRNFGAAILEFRNNYQKAEPYNQYAVRAYELLNKFTEDDTLVDEPVLDEAGNVVKDKNGNVKTQKVPAKVGDLLLDSSYVVQPGPTYGKGYTPPQLYRNILMMGNSTIVAAVNTALVLGCTETEGTTFLDRLDSATYSSRLNAGRNAARNTLADVLEEFRETLLLAKDTYETAMAFDGGKEAYIKQFAPKDNKTYSLESNEEEYDITQYNEVIQQLTLVEIMKSINYGDCEDDDGNQLTFFDAMLLPTAYTPGCDVLLTDQMIDVLAKSMTTGQIAISQYSGLAPLIFNAYNSKNPSVTTEDGKKRTVTDIMDEYIEALEPEETLSVYTGVDRSIFNDTTNTVAITNAVIKEQSKKTGGGIGCIPEYNEGDKSWLAVGIAGSVVSAISILSGSLTALRIFREARTVYQPIYEISYKITDTVSNLSRVETYTGTMDAFIDASASFSVDPANAGLALEITESTATGQVQSTLTGVKDISYSTSIGTKIKLGFDVVFAIIGLVVAIIGFVEWKKSQTLKELEYTPIPRAILDVRYKETGGVGYYFNYYVAKLPNTGDEDYKTEKDTTKLYGDLNGLNNVDPWLALYYARDRRLGSPLTPTALLQNTAKLNPLKEKPYLPVHDFMNTDFTANSTSYAAFDMNHTNGNATKSSLFLFFYRDRTVLPVAASLFNETSFAWSSLIFFLLGAGMATTGTWLVMKRKIKKHKASAPVKT